MINKPDLYETDIWARTADPVDVQKPLQDIINRGFLYGEKPPHEGHNFYWQVFSEFLVHLNQNGVPEWDNVTEYNQGALTKEGDMTYFALQPSIDKLPSANPAFWDVAYREKARDADKLDGMEPNELPISDATAIALGEKIDRSGDVMEGILGIDEHSLQIYKGDITAQFDTEKLFMKDNVTGTEAGMYFDKTNIALDFKFNDDIMFSLEPNQAPNTPYQPTLDEHITRKDYVDGQITGHNHDSRYVNIDGDTMTNTLRIDGDSVNPDAGLQISSGVNSANMKSNYFELRSDTHHFRIEDDFANIEIDFKIDDATMMSLEPGVAPKTPHQPTSANHLTRMDYVDNGLALKADITYVDSENATQDTIINQKADTTYVDSEISDVDSRKYNKTDHIDISAGTADNGKPIILNAEGKVDYTMLDSGAYPVGAFTPVDGAEYPDTTGERPGVYWAVIGVDSVNGYTFLTGDLAGQTVLNGDIMQWGSQSWLIVDTGLVSDEYYRLDGTYGLLADFSGGGYKISDIAMGTEAGDGIEYQQWLDKNTLQDTAIQDVQTNLDGHTALTDNPHSVTASQVGLDSVDNTADIDKPISTATQTALDLKSDIIYVDTELALKSDLTYVDTELALKSDLTYVDAELALKADTTYVDSENATQDTEIALKAYQTDLDDLDVRTYDQSDFIETSVGAGDAGKPIILNSQGHLDPSFIDASTFHYVGDFTPASGAEYPDISAETPGAFWAVQGVDASNGYTFTGGDLSGKTVENGDFMVWGTGGWSIMVGEMNPTLYYKLDGTQALTAPFAGGGQQLKNIGAGSANGDAVEYAQWSSKNSSQDTATATAQSTADTAQSEIDSHEANVSNPHGVTPSQIGSPDGTWTWDGTTLAITI